MQLSPDRTIAGVAEATGFRAQSMPRAGHLLFATGSTVLVFVADHSHEINGAARIPRRGYGIPMLFYSPRPIAARRVDTLAAQIDLAPTLPGRLGPSYESNFSGVDLMRVRPGEGRIVVAHNFSIHVLHR